MKERWFDSQGSDAKPMHREPYQNGCGAIHALGTGNIMLYSRGPEWMQVIGEPYSCPSVFALIVPEGESLQAKSWRREGVGGWTHQLPQGNMEDCAPRGQNCIARRWSLRDPVCFKLDSLDHGLADVRGLFPESSHAWLVTVEANAKIYNDYPIGRRTYMFVVITGGCAAEPVEKGIALTLTGNGTLYVTGSRNYEACYRQMCDVAALSFDALRAEADDEDRAFLARCAKNRAPLKEHPLSDRVWQAADETALMIRAQQHIGGGVQAGHNGHLAYVRDQYGVSRGLIAMGALEEAKAILEFYRGVFERWGLIANAQAMGVDGIFHVHENDHVEITGYLLLQAADYFEATGDEAFLRKLLPMLGWALKVQLDWLHNDMLPFNGDETYIAGGIIPRTILDHGSFEATLLLIIGGRRFLSLCRALGWIEEWMKDAARCIDHVSERFDANFRRGECYMTNSLNRMKNLKAEEIRHGVCNGDGRFGWMHHVEEGVYLCPNCMGKRKVAPCREEYQLKSTLLMVPFINSNQLSNDYMAEQVDDFLSVYREIGALPSRPDGKRCVGYDYGLMLFAAKKTNRQADDLLESMLALQDAAGAWSEYYRGSKPEQTRCRPWESGMNIAGALRYLAKD